MTARTPVLTDVLWHDRGLARQAALVLGGTAVLAVSAKIAVPFWPVPMTMQSLAIMLIGLSYGSRLGAATVAAYLLEGLLGLPVFAAATAGPFSFVGPSGGYLFGFLIAAAVIGALAERGWDRSFPWAVTAMIVGHVLLFIPGVLWLAHLFGWADAVAFGLTPFIAATLLKTALGAALVAAAWSRIEARLSRP